MGRCVSAGVFRLLSSLWRCICLGALHRSLGALHRGVTGCRHRSAEACEVVGI